MGTLIDSETQDAEYPAGIKALVPPNLGLTRVSIRISWVVVG